MTATTPAQSERRAPHQQTTAKESSATGSRKASKVGLAGQEQQPQRQAVDRDGLRSLIESQGLAVKVLQEVAGIPRESLDGKHHPCPECGGKDRFRLVDAVKGGVICNQCCPTGCGDVFSTVQHYRKLTGRTGFRLALGAIADCAGVTLATPPAKGKGSKASGVSTTGDVVADVATEKRMPLGSFKAYGAAPAMRGNREVARVPVYDGDGKAVSYLDLIPGESKGKFPRGGTHGIFLPGRVPKPGETWNLVEGVKDAAAIHGLELPNTAGIPTSKLSTKFCPLFAGCEVITIPDLDRPGMDGAQVTAANLQGIAASVKIARLPGEISETNGQDCRDIIHGSPDGADAVRTAIATAVPWDPNAAPIDGRPEVVVTLREAEVADQVCKHLGSLGWESSWIPEAKREAVKVYQQGGRLLAVAESEDRNNPPGTKRISQLKRPTLRERITQACRLVIERETEKDGPVERQATSPPKWLVESIESRGNWGGFIRPVSGIVQAPTIREDGTILQTPGWDPATGLIYAPLVDFPAVPESPAKGEAIAAAARLLEVVADFPFLADSDRSAWLSLVLTLIARQCIDGCTPIHPITANIRGAGKSLLADAASMIAFGKPASRVPFSRDDVEMRKVITAFNMEGAESVLFDNLSGPLSGASLDAAVTSRTWKDRILSKSETTELPFRTVIIATGNNLPYGTDIARRVLPIRLASPLENPEERDGFRTPDLLSSIAADRPALAVAALTILRAYFAAGAPAQPGGRMGGFESWVRVIRGAIVWAGLPDPLLNRESAKSSDESADLLRMLVYGLEEAAPGGDWITVKEIERLTSHATPADERSSIPTLLEAVATVCGGKFNGKAFANRLKSYSGRIIDGRKIESQTAGKGVKKWRTGPAEGGLGGLGGFDLALPYARGNDNQTVDGCEYVSRDTCIEGAETNPPNPPKQPLGAGAAGLVTWADDDLSGDWGAF